MVVHETSLSSLAGTARTAEPPKEKARADMANDPPLYRQIADQLIERIEQNVLRPGDQIPTEQELSVAFGVSRITAVRAVKELETRGLVSRTKGRGSFVRSHGSWVEDSGQRKFPIVSLMLPFHEMLALGVLLGVEQVVRERGFHTSLRNSTASVDHEREILTSDPINGVAGMIVYPCSSVRNVGALSSLVVRRFPLVLIDRRVRGIETPFVSVDNEQGAYLAVKHLLDLGHRRVAFYADDAVSIDSEADRFRGYCRALLEYRVAIRDDLIFDRFADTGGGSLGGVLPEPFSLVPSETTRRIVDTILSLKEPPTAIVAVNDAAAVGVIRSALDRGVSVPGDLSVVGFDNLAFTEHVEVPITTIEQPFRRIGERAARMLLRRIDHPSEPFESEILEPKLIVRASTGPPRSGGG